MDHEVKSEFVDSETGKRYVPAPRGAQPTIFTPHNDDQRDRLIAAGCLIAEGVAGLSAKPIEELTRPELETLAVASFREQLSTASDDDLRSALQRHRDKSVGDSSNDGSALGAGNPAGSDGKPNDAKGKPEPPATELKPEAKEPEKAAPAKPQGRAKA